jgi:hypothetical protein
VAIALLTLLTLGIPVSVWAQEQAAAFDRVADDVSEGDTIFVTDANGHTFKGRIVTLKADELVLDVGQTAPIAFTADRVRKMAYPTRMVLPGALLGFCIGAGVMVANPGGNARGGPAFGWETIMGGIIVGGLGAVTGIFIRGKRVFYNGSPAAPGAPLVMLAPIIGTDAKGIAIAVRF